MVAAANRPATEAVAGFSFGGGGGHAPSGPKVLLVQNRKLGGFCLFCFQKGRKYQKKKKNQNKKKLFVSLRVPVPGLKGPIPGLRGLILGLKKTIQS